MNIMFESLNFEEEQKSYYTLDEMLEMFIKDKYVWELYGDGSIFDGLLYIIEILNADEEIIRVYRIKDMKRYFNNVGKVSLFLDIQKRNYKIDKLINI